ncbi:hypothetical protein CEXT_705641 [Caerostris extrusa]|uniref:Uncharacterized protein n=1 Tax=Caerostris extrusa TaxID=172846 RepID=A0AAV4MP14_CAEEX|nr:hypothetical protein CEXT_705641 [Caerostris extrusa]
MACFQTLTSYEGKSHGSQLSAAPANDSLPSCNVRPLSTLPTRNNGDFSRLFFSPRNVSRFCSVDNYIASSGGGDWTTVGVHETAWFSLSLVSHLADCINVGDIFPYTRSYFNEHILLLTMTHKKADRELYK